MASFVDKLVPSPSCNGAAALATERAQSQLSEDKLAQHLFGGTGFLERQARILPIVAGNPLFAKGTQANLSRPDRFKLAVARVKRLRQLTAELKWDEDDYSMARVLVDEMLPFDLHLSMFVTTIRQQGNEEQAARWLPDAEACKIIGAYAQV